MRKLSLIALVLLAAPVAAAPEDRGAHSVEEWSTSAESAGITMSTKVYYPGDVGAPAPVVVVAHGASRTGDNMAEMSATLASRGLIAVTPNYPCNFTSCDHDENADQLLGLFQWASNENEREDSPLFGRMDLEAKGIIGHSFGALAATVGAAQDSSLDVMVLLDPQDDQGLGLQRASALSIPSLQLYAETPGLCNSMWSDEVIRALDAPRFALEVVGSGHCDAEEPGDSLCPLACGSGDPTTSTVFRRYTVAFVSCVLNPSAEVADFVGGVALEADRDANVVTKVETYKLDETPCADLRTQMEAPAPGVPDNDNQPADDDKGGCSCRTGEGPGFLLGIFTLALLVTRRLRKLEA